MGMSVCHNPNSIEFIVKQICTWHDSIAAIVCAKLCSDAFASNKVTVNQQCDSIWIAMDKSLAKLVPELSTFLVIQCVSTEVIIIMCWSIQLHHCSTEMQWWGTIGPIVTPTYDYISRDSFKQPRIYVYNNSVQSCTIAALILQTQPVFSQSKCNTLRSFMYRLYSILQISKMRTSDFLAWGSLWW